MSSDADASRTERAAGATPPRAARSRLTQSPQGRVVLAMMVVWMVVAAVRNPRDAQDAVPLVVAGELVRSDPGQVYIDEDGSLFDLEAHFKDRSCEIVGTAMDCEQTAVAFVSPPPALPLVAGLSLLGPDLALRLLRLVGAGLAVVGMLALWDRLARLRPRAPTYLAVTAVAITPLVLFSIGLGQTSPLMFASAALGVTAWDRRGWTRVALVALLVALISLKLLPVVLLGVLVVQRRWILLGSVVGTVALLSVLGLALGGTDMANGYVVASGAVQDQGTSNPYNGALDSALYQVAHDVLSTDAVSLLANGARVALVIAIAIGVWRLPRDDRQWALAWAGLVVVAPLVWWHYALASIGALGTALAHARSTDRDLRLLPIVAVIGLPFGIMNSASHAAPALQWLWALAVLVLVWVITSRSARADRERDTTAASA